MANLVRKLILKIPGSMDKPIEMRVSEPYFPAKRAGMQMFYGCEVHFLTGDAAPVECLGMDAMQAIGAAIRILDIYLSGLSKRNEGAQLVWENGEVYDPLEDGWLRAKYT